MQCQSGQKELNLYPE